MSKTTTAPRRLSRAVLAGSTVFGLSMMSALPALANVEPVNEGVEFIDDYGYGVQYNPIQFEDVDSIFLGSLAVSEEHAPEGSPYLWGTQWGIPHDADAEVAGEGVIDSESAAQANYIIQRYQDNRDMHPEIAAAIHDLLDNNEGSALDNGHLGAIHDWVSVRDRVEDSDDEFEPIGEGTASLEAVLDNADLLVADAETHAGAWEIDLDFGEVDSVANTVDVTVNVLDGADEPVADDEFSDGEDSGIELEITAAGVGIVPEDVESDEPEAEADNTDTEEDDGAEDAESTGDAEVATVDSITVAPGDTVSLANVGWEGDQSLSVESNEVFPGSTVEELQYTDIRNKVFQGSTEALTLEDAAVPTALEPTAPDAPEVDVNVTSQASENVIRLGDSIYSTLTVTGFDALSEYVDEPQTVESQVWFTGDVNPSNGPMSFEEFQNALESGEIEASLVSESSTVIDGDTIDNTEDTVTDEESEGVVLDGQYATESFTPIEDGYYVYTESFSFDEAVPLIDEATNEAVDVPIQIETQSDFGRSAATVFVKSDEGQHQQQHQDVILDIVNNPQINISFDKDGNLVDGDGNPVDEDDVVDEYGDDDKDKDTGDGSDTGDGDGDGNGNDDGDDGDDFKDGDDGVGDGNGIDDDVVVDDAAIANEVIADADGPVLETALDADSDDDAAEAVKTADQVEVISGNTSGGQTAAWAGAGLLGLAGIAGIAARKFFRRSTAIEDEA